jgi:hypothetical protein
MFESLAEYPHDFVLACVAVAGIGVLWVLFKLVKMALWTLVWIVLAVALATAVGLFHS